MFLALTLFFLAKFIDYNEERVGFTFVDPLLSLFNPINVTWWTFILIYGGLIVALVSISQSPWKLLIAFQAYTLIASLRLITIYFLPLNPPPHIIPLTDPFIEFFGGGETLLKDLFFSGHTSTMFLFALLSKSKKMKYVFVAATVLVAASVLVQHVHYTIDVIVAPFFAYACYRIARLINKKKTRNNLESI